MEECNAIRTPRGDWFEITLKGDYTDTEKMVIHARVRDMAGYHKSLILGGSTTFRYNGCRVFIIRRSREYVEENFYLPGQIPESVCPDLERPDVLVQGQAGEPADVRTAG